MKVGVGDEDGDPRDGKRDGGHQHMGVNKNKVLWYIRSIHNGIHLFDWNKI